MQQAGAFHKLSWTREETDKCHDSGGRINTNHPVIDSGVIVSCHNQSQLLLCRSEVGKLCSSRNVVGIMPIPVSIVPAVCIGVPKVPVVAMTLLFEVPKFFEIVLKTIATAHCRLLLKGSVPKVAVCNLVLTKE